MRLRFRTGEALEHDGSTVDLGMGGAFVHTRNLPNVGEPVVVLLASPTAWDELELAGRVRWVHDGQAGKERGFGVKFDPIDPTLAKALYELLQANAFIDEDEES
jgi:Tfp pilus assembly protein PilZ